MRRERERRDRRDRERRRRGLEGERSWLEGLLLTSAIVGAGDDALPAVTSAT